MCQFLSAIVLRNGDVLTHPMLDSHSDLATYFGLPDTSAYAQHFAKVELRPVDWLDPQTWTWIVDEPTVPGWWADVATAAEATLRERAARMVIRGGEKRLIVDGCWIVGGDAVVRDVRAGRIVRVQDSAQVRGVWGSAQVHDVGGSAQVRGVGGSAQVHDVGGSAQVHDVWGSAQVHDVWGSAQVRGVCGSAQVRGVRDSAQVHGVWGSAQVHGVWGSAQVHDVGPDVVLDESARAHLVQT